MIGIGLVKDSEAVFFQYLGDDSTQALVRANGAPVTRMGPEQVTGVSIAEDVYREAGFSGSKLNLFLVTQSGKTLMVTSGLTTIWSQCVMTGLMGLADTGRLNSVICLDSWKGNSKMRPCFGAIKVNNQRRSSDEMYQALTDARADRDNALISTILRDAVQTLGNAVGTPAVDAVDVKVEEPAF